jgi:hypothetical protein
MIVYIRQTLQRCSVVVRSMSSHHIVFDTRLYTTIRTWSHTHNFDGVFWARTRICDIPRTNAHAAFIESAETITSGLNSL